MNLEKLRDRCRAKTGDLKKPYLWSDDEWRDYFNEAVNEACIRARLIEQDGIELDQTANDAYADIPEHVWSVQRVTFNGRRLMLCDKAMLDDCEGDAWEERTADIPIACFEVSGRLRFYPIPTTAGDVQMHGFCTPETPMKEDADEPIGVRVRLHEKLLDWALHAAYSKADADTFNAALADKYEAAFERVFGPRPDEKAMRRLRINVRRSVKASYF
jgi:hypothetical protein